MKDAPRKESAVFFSLFIGLMAICLITGPASAAEKAAQKKPASPAATQQTIELKTEDLKFEQKPSRRIPSKMTSSELGQATSGMAAKSLTKPDLICEIKAYYDEAKTMPVPGESGNGTYHMSPQLSPPRPSPIYAFFFAEVKNAGMVKSQGTSTKLTVTGNFFSMPPSYFPLYPLDPGEAMEYPYVYGPFMAASCASFNGQKLSISATADHPQHVVEGSEGNNNCTYTLSFVCP